MFENVDGGDVPVLINLFGTHQRVAWALGVDHIDKLTARVRKLLGTYAGATRRNTQQVEDSRRPGRASTQPAQDREGTLLARRW